MPNDRLPRDLDARTFLSALRKLGYEEVRRTGSHVRIRTVINGEHAETIPFHAPLKIGTLNKILNNIAGHHHMSRKELIRVIGI